MGSQLTIRPASPADIPAIADVMNAHSLEVLGTRRVLIGDTGKLRCVRYIPDDGEQLVATTEDGTIVAFAYVRPEQHPVVYETQGAVHPSYRGQGIGTQFLEWAERRTLEHAQKAPLDTNVVLQCNVFDNDHHTRALLVERGYAQVREWIHLKIEFDSPLPAPELPDGIIIRTMDQRRDWPKVGRALEEAFADHWGQIQPSSELAADHQDEDTEEDEDDTDDPYFNSRDFCFVALHGDEVVGSCLGNARTVEWADEGRVGSLSIRRQYRGRGIGRALMLHAFRAFYDHGVRYVSTDTDADSFTGSYRLYLGLGMHIFRREQLYEKSIRPGRELRLLAPEEGGMAAR